MKIINKKIINKIYYILICKFFITTKRAMSGYNGGYEEGYAEGYNEGYEEAKKEFSKELSPKKIKLENTLDIHEYTKEVCDKKQIMEHLNLAQRQQTTIDIYYDGGSESGWRIGCKISYMENGKTHVSYWKNTGVYVIRTFKLNKIKAAYLGNYIPWDVKKQVSIIEKELDWKGDNVEGIPENYNYEKIECMMQGVRDYIKFLKRGFGRTAHLTSIDIRNGRMDRKKAEELCKIYDGKKPKSLSLFLKLINLSEDKFYDIVKEHIISPSKIWDKSQISKDTSNISPSDFDEWEKKFF